MPTYEYRCEANDRVIEVQHPMSRTVRTWGEVCDLAEIDPGDTPRKSPVEKILSLSFVSGSKPDAGPSFPGGGCGAGCGCHPN
ncbi:MAG: zinc ribbon domain-containing protein [Phycisphaerales bacterium JB040]